MARTVAMIALGVRAGVAGRRDVDDKRPIFAVVSGCGGYLAQEHPHVVADRLCQAGRGHADQLRLVLASYVLQGRAAGFRGRHEMADVSPKLDEAMSIGSLKWLIM